MGAMKPKPPGQPAAPAVPSVAAAAARAEADVETGLPTVLPLLEERIDVALERVDIGALRVRIVVDESVENAVIDLASTEVRPRVVPHDMEVDARREPYVDGEDLVVPVYEERAVLVRKLFLKEEVRLTRTRHQQQQPFDVPLRRERAVVERQQADGSWLPEPSPLQGAPIAKSGA